MRTATDGTLYLLDVNVLVALSWPNHLHHARASAWWSQIEAWATTPVTEAAFLRLSINPAVVGQGVSFAEASAMLTAIRATPGHVFLDDDSSLARPHFDVSRIATPGQITDAHLVNLAAGSGAVLATLDAGIPSMLSPADRRHVVVLPG